MLRLPGNDLSERRRSHISQESQFVLRNDCGGLARNGIYSALLMLARVIRVEICIKTETNILLVEQGNYMILSYVC